MDSDISVGQIVQSKAGRDKDKYFFVLQVIDENYVLIADGDFRRIASPKKKKIKHLTITQFKDERLKRIINEDKRVTDALLKRSLNSLILSHREV